MHPIPDDATLYDYRDCFQRMSTEMLAAVRETADWNLRAKFLTSCPVCGARERQRAHAQRCVHPYHHQKVS